MENIEENIDDNDKAIFLLRSLARSPKLFKSTLIYLRFKELSKMKDLKGDYNGESFSVSKEKSESREEFKSKFLIS